MMQSKTPLSFAPHATQSCIGELNNDHFLMDPLPLVYPTTPAFRCAQSFEGRIKTNISVLSRNSETSDSRNRQFL
jgi:hypothetical protein